jgi:hypothetical protein
VSPVPVGQVARARRVARTFLADYLRFAYGRASASSVHAVSLALQRQLMRDHAQVTPVERRRRPRVVSLTTVGQGPGTASVSVSGCVGAPGGYINPFKGEAWAPARNDTGVDYDPLKVEPVRAIGAGTIVSIGSWGMYGPWSDYRLAGGRFAGKCIYVAEHIGSILKPGTRFSAGDTIATAYPGPYWTEWEGPKRSTPRQCPWSQCGCTEQDNVDPGGRALARFLRSLGAKTLQNPGPGPMYAGESC